MADRRVRGRLHRGAEEDDSYCVLPGRADAGLILLCDHAGNALPPDYGTLGLPPEQLERHIAYDIGAAAGHARARGRARRAGGHDALLAAADRSQPRRDDPTLIMRLSDGAVVPGNRRSTQPSATSASRLYYEPYHRAIDAVIDQCLASRRRARAAVDPFLHRELEGRAAALACRRALGPATGDWPRRCSTRFYAEGDLIVGDNEPYAGQLEGDCLWQHGTSRGLANALIEIRQDLIRDAAGQAGLGGPALPHCREDSAHYIAPASADWQSAPDAAAAAQTTDALHERMEWGHDQDRQARW